jgi:hypothetical protein
MEAKKHTEALTSKLLKGLEITMEKLKENAAKNNQPLVVSINGKIQHVYPGKNSSTENKS